MEDSKQVEREEESVAKKDNESVIPPPGVTGEDGFTNNVVPPPLENEDVPLLLQNEQKNYDDIVKLLKCGVEIHVIASVKGVTLEEVMAFIHLKSIILPPPPAQGKYGEYLKILKEVNLKQKDIIEKYEEKTETEGKLKSIEKEIEDEKNELKRLEERRIEKETSLSGKKRKRDDEDGDESDDNKTEKKRKMNESL